MKRAKPAARLVRCMCAALTAHPPSDWEKGEVLRSRQMENGCWRVRRAPSMSYFNFRQVRETRASFQQGTCSPNPLTSFRIRGTFWKWAVSRTMDCGYGYKTPRAVNPSQSVLRARWSAGGNGFRRMENKSRP